MKSLAEIAALALSLAVQDAPPAGDSPRATSGEAQRYDQVERAVAGATVTHTTLTAGTIIEVTSLADGVTLLLRVEGSGAGEGGIALPPPLLARLTSEAQQHVRVRVVTASPQEEAQLRAGQPVERLAAPAALLTGLHRRLPAAAASSPSAPTPAVVSAPLPQKPAVASTGWLVQVAALSNEVRAKALAAELNGSAQPSGNLWRVQIGPFTARAAADSARAKAVARGFSDAQILRTN